jgi:hypothetical protein
MESRYLFTNKTKESLVVMMSQHMGTGKVRIEYMKVQWVQTTCSNGAPSFCRIWLVAYLKSAVKINRVET